jgi:2-hydroxy-3-oxopropionate reductase
MSSADRDPTVGVVGLGVMGELILGALLRSGYARVHVYDIDAGRVKRAVASGATACMSSTAVARAADVVVLSLPGPDAVRDVVLGNDGIVAAGFANTVLVDTSTVSIDISLRAHAACLEVGIGFVDAPVTGRPPLALTFVGGDAATVDRCWPVLTRIARDVQHVGPAGAGTACKLANQLLLYDAVAAFSEAMSLVELAGFDAGRVGAALQRSPMASRFLDNVGPKVTHRRYAEVDGAPLKLIAKDMSLLVEFARHVGAAASRAEYLCSVFSEAVDRGLGDEHFAAVGEVIRARLRAAVGDGPGEQRQSGGDLC